MSVWSQENFKGQMLALKIEEKKLVNGGKCAEFSAKIQNDAVQYGFMFGLGSAIVCLIMSIYLAVPSRFTDCFSLLCAFSSISFIVLTSAKIFFRISSETVLFVPEMGIQLTGEYKCGMKTQKFIPNSDFGGVLINEDIGWDHAFYLAVELKDKKAKQKLIPLFENTTPRLAYLQNVLGKFQELTKKTG